MEQKIIDAVKACMSDKRSGKGVTLQSNLRSDLEYDSLDTMVLLAELETVFDINIDESDFTDIVTVSDIAEKLRGITDV